MWWGMFQAQGEYLAYNLLMCLKRGKQVNKLLHAYRLRTVHRHPRGDLQHFSKSPYVVNIRLRLF